MAGFSAAVDRLTAALGRLPGIGAKSAERLAHHLLKCPPEEALELAEAIRAAKEQIRHCQVCFHLTEADQPALRDLPRSRAATRDSSAWSSNRATCWRSRRPGRSRGSTTSCWAGWPRSRGWARSS